MAALTGAEIATLARNAGFKGNDVNIAVAVALAESSGNSRAHNAVPPDNSYGLWQINMLGTLGPDRRKRFGLKSNSDLYDPATNARVAYGIWKGSGWKAWTTYTRGTYKKYLTDAPQTESGTDATITPVSDESGGGLNLGSGVTGAIDNFSGALSKGFANTIGILLAIALLVLGVVILGREQIAKVTPLGKVGKLIK